MFAGPGRCLLVPNRSKGARGLDWAVYISLFLFQIVSACFVARVRAALSRVNMVYLFFGLTKILNVPRYMYQSG